MQQLIDVLPPEDLFIEKSRENDVFVRRLPLIGDWRKAEQRRRWMGVIGITGIIGRPLLYDYYNTITISNTIDACFGFGFGSPFGSTAVSLTLTDSTLAIEWLSADLTQNTIIVILIDIYLCSNLTSDSVESLKQVNNNSY